MDTVDPEVQSEDLEFPADVKAAESGGSPEEHRRRSSRHWPNPASRKFAALRDTLPIQVARTRR